MLVDKSRRRDERALDYGTYRLTDVSTNATLTPESGIYLDEVEKFLATGPYLADGPRAGQGYVA